MVDIKRQDITLQDRTKGISADEFAWGSYFYSEAISSWYNTKGFELGYRLAKYEINSRANGYAAAIVPTRGQRLDFVAFTHDWRMEAQNFYNGSLEGDWDNDAGGALYALPIEFSGEEYTTYLNGLRRGNYLIGIKGSAIDVVDYTDVFDPNAEELSNPRFENSWADRTIGTWRTITDNWAEHTPGNTGTLSASFGAVIPSTKRMRVAIKIKNSTTGKVEIDIPGTWYTAETEWGVNGRFVFNIKGSSSATWLTITPSSGFNGTIEAVNVHLFNLSNVFDNKVFIWGYDTQYYPHPALIWGGDLYIAVKSDISVISLTDRGNNIKKIIDENYTIVALTQQAGNIIIWATDWYDSKQYYWNGVDNVASEIIEWKGLIIQWVTGTETVSYVLTTSGQNVGSIEGYEYRLYAVSWYQRSLIASKLYQSWSDFYLDIEHYNPNKKFDFNDVSGEQSMTIFLDSLYIPGCDWIYKYGYDIPWLRTNRTRPIKYDTKSKYIVLWQRGHFLGIGYQAAGVNYIGEVDNRLYPTTWYLVTESIYRDKLSTRKALEKLKIWYKNVASSVGNIKIYAIVDDTYFWRFRPSSTPTNRPEIWDIYSVANDTTAKVINVDKTNGVITFVTVENGGSYDNLANTTLTKISWEWDNTITVGYNYDNMCLIKTIESEEQGYGSDLIFWKNFVNNYIPYRHKIQFVIELNSNDRMLSPEIYELSMISDITDVTL